MNGRYAQPSQPLRPRLPFPKSMYPIDTRIRFRIHRIEYYYEDGLNQLFLSRTDTAQAATARTAGRAARRNAALARDPSLMRQLNIYVSTPAPNGGGGGYATMPTAFMTEAEIVYLHNYLPQTESLWADADFAFSVLLGHELGHCLGLSHTYASPDAPPICDTANADYLADVFGRAGNATCPHDGGWDADFALWPPYCTNNLMGGTRDSSWISPLQAAVMQRALTDMSARRYLATGCDDCGCGIAFTVRGDSDSSSGPPSQLPYPTVDLNEGWGWRISDFMAPVAGTYHFDLIFQKDTPGTNDDVFVLIQKNGTVIGQAWAGEGTLRGTGAASLNVRLARGDVVNSLVASDGGVGRKISQYVFSGHLLCGCA